MFGKAFLKNILPETTGAKLLAGFGFTSFLGLSFIQTYSFYYRNRIDPYKKSVCWDHYSKFYLESI